MLGFRLCLGPKLTHDTLIVSYEFIILGKADEEPEKINNFKNILLFVLEILTSVIVVLKRHIRDIMSLTCHDIM